MYNVCITLYFARILKKYTFSIGVVLFDNTLAILANTDLVCVLNTPLILGASIRDLYC